MSRENTLKKGGINPVFIRLAAIVTASFFIMAFGDSAGAEEGVSYYTDIDVDTNPAVETKVEEVDKEEYEGLGSDTTGKATVRYYDEKTGVWIEAEVAISDDKQRAGIRITKEF